MDFPDFEGSKEFQTLETIYQSDRHHVPEDLNHLSTPAITSNNALYFVLLEYNIGLHGKNKTMENYRYRLQLFTRINQQLFTNTLWKMDP
jgi:hypothetical protein